MKYIIWDFNGTIVDDGHLCFEIEMKMLKDRKMYADYDYDWYLHHFRFPVIEYYKDMGYDLEKEDFNDIIENSNFTSKGDFLMEISRTYDLNLALKRNKSLKYFLNKLNLLENNC